MPVAHRTTDDRPELQPLRFLEALQYHDDIRAIDSQECVDQRIVSTMEADANREPST